MQVNEDGRSGIINNTQRISITRFPICIITKEKIILSTKNITVNIDTISTKIIIQTEI